MDNIRTVKFFASQDAEDLYRCEENGRVYVRQECDEEYVRWLTTSKWKGGYEADCPLKEGIIIHVVDRSGKLLFREAVIKADGYSDTVAEKIGPFSGEPLVGLANKIKELFALASYDEWKAWLMEAAELSGYKGYYENWLYDAEYGKPEKIAQLDYLGVRVYAIKQTAKHHKAEKTWTDYEIRTDDLSTCLSICGYKLEEN